MEELIIKAVVENVSTVTAFINEQLDAINCPVRAHRQINVAVDELFGNIAHYAYGSKEGEATVRVEVKDNPMAVIITFIDNGIPYDPLKKQDPDTSIPLEEREIGGLGIFIVKKSMDEIEYKYENGQNMLMIKKYCL